MHKKGRRGVRAAIFPYNSHCVLRSS